MRKAGAQIKSPREVKKNETYMAGITESAEFVQKFSDPRGSKLDHDVAEAVN